jgi:hypothetical protein
MADLFTQANILKILSEYKAVLLPNISSYTQEEVSLELENNDEAIVELGRGPGQCKKCS